MDLRILRDTVAAAEQRLMQALRNLVQFTTVTRSTAKGDEDGADGWPDAGKAYQRATRRMQHFGFRSRPPKNTAAVMLLVGGGSASEVTVAEGSDGYGPDDLADGEVAIFSKKAGALIKIDASGNITVKAPSPAKVVIEADHVFLGGESGADKLVRKSDFDGHTHGPGTFATPSAGGAGGAVTGLSGGADAATGTTNTKAK